jgi:hypothetical protein
MPVEALVKSTGVQWASDGRLVIVGDFDVVGRQLATWVPGEPELRVQPFDFETYASIAALVRTDPPALGPRFVD